MKKQLLLLFTIFCCIQFNYAQVISMIGSNSPSGSWSVDTNMNTTDNVTYTLNNATVTTATDPNTTGMKFRQNADWAVNWGAADFPSGTGTQNGPNILTQAGTYNITFNRSNGNYVFTNTLSNTENTLTKLKIYPNPTSIDWILSHTASIDSVQLFDINGKELEFLQPQTNEMVLSGKVLPNGLYYVKIKSGLDFTVQKIIKN